MDARVTREQFKSSAELRKSALDLYDAVLCTIKGLITWLDAGGASQKMRRRILRPSLSAGELDDMLGAMHVKVQAYQRCLQKVLNATFLRIDSKTRAISSESRITRAMVTETKIDVWGIKQSAGAISDEARQISVLLKQLQADYQNAEERRELETHVQNAFCRTLIDEINSIKGRYSHTSLKPS